MAASSFLRRIALLAAVDPAFRRTLRRKLLASEEHHRWDEYLEHQWDGGKKKVPNPDWKPGQAERYRDIEMLTRYKKDPAFRKRISDDFHQFVQSEDPVSDAPSQQRRAGDIIRKHIPKPSKDIFNQDYLGKAKQAFLEFAGLKNGQKAQRVADSWMSSAVMADALRLQGAAAEMGAKDHPDSKITPSQSETRKQITDEDRDLARLVYDFTQAFLETHGIEEIDLYRSSNLYKEHEPGESIHPVTRNLSGWTSDKDAEVLDGPTVKTTAPRSQIMMIPTLHTGHDVFKESEFIVRDAASLKSERV